MLIYRQIKLIRNFQTARIPHPASVPALAFNSQIDTNSRAFNGQVDTNQAVTFFLKIIQKFLVRYKNYTYLCSVIQKQTKKHGKSSKKFY